MSGYVNIASAERMSLNNVSYPYSRMFCNETPKYLGQEYSVIIYVQLIDLAFYVKLNLFINNLILLIININNFSPVLLQTALCLFCEEKRALARLNPPILLKGPTTSVPHFFFSPH